MIETHQSCIYWIDSEDRIVHVNQAWIDFARENDAPELAADQVLGRLLTDFIDGNETLALYAALNNNVRARRQPVVIPFRCDSPSVVRQMTLTLRPLEDGAIEYEGRLIRKTERAPLTILFRLAERSGRTIPICSLCRRVAVKSQWLELGDVVMQISSLHITEFPRLLETVCPECKGFTD